MDNAKAKLATVTLEKSVAQANYEKALAELKTVQAQYDAYQAYLAAKAEADRLEAERIEAERKAEEARIKAEQDAKAKAEAEKLANEAKAKAEAERLAKEAAEKARLEAEKKAQEEAAAKAKAEEEAKRLQEEIAKAQEEAERIAREKAEEEANNQNGTGSEIPVVPTQPKQPTEPIGEPTKPIEEPTQPETPSEKTLIAEKGDPAYHEVPAFDISEITKQLGSRNKAGKLEEQSSAHVTNVVLKADKSVEREVQNSSTVLQNSAEKSDYSQVQGEEILPNTGQTNSSILQMVGLGLVGLRLVVKRKKYK